MKKISLLILGILALFCVSAKQVIKAEESFTITNMVALSYDNNQVLPIGNYREIKRVFEGNIAVNEYIFTFRNLDTKAEYRVNGKNLPKDLYNKDEEIYPIYFRNIKVINGYWAYIQQDFARDSNDNLIPNSVGKFSLYSNITDPLYKYEYFLTGYSEQEKALTIIDTEVKVCYVYASNIPKSILTDSEFYTNFWGVINANWDKAKLTKEENVIEVKSNFVIDKGTNESGGGWHWYSYLYSVYLDFNIEIDTLLEIEYQFTHVEYHPFIFWNKYQNETIVNETVFADDVINIQNGFWFWQKATFNKIEKGNFTVYNESEKMNYTYTFRIQNYFFSTYGNCIYKFESYSVVKLTYIYDNVVYEVYNFDIKDETDKETTDQQKAKESFLEWLVNLIIKPFKWLFENLLRLLYIFIGIVVVYFIIRIIISASKKKSKKNDKGR